MLNYVLSCTSKSEHKTPAKEEGVPHQNTSFLQQKVTRDNRKRVFLVTKMLSSSAAGNIHMLYLPTAT